MRLRIQKPKVQLNPFKDLQQNTTSIINELTITKLIQDSNERKEKAPSVFYQSKIEHGEGKYYTEKKEKFKINNTLHDHNKQDIMRTDYELKVIDNFTIQLKQKDNHQNIKQQQVFIMSLILQQFNIQMCDLSQGTSILKSVRRRKANQVEKTSQEFICEYEDCKQIFSRFSRLKTHYIKVHKYKKFFKCIYPNCLKSFSEKGNLAVHFRQHTAEKPFKCSYCPMAFTSQGNRTDHERRHQNFKYQYEPFKYVFRPYSCEYCNMSYYRKYLLTEHISNKHLIHSHSNNAIQFKDNSHQNFPMEKKDDVIIGCNEQMAMALGNEIIEQIKITQENEQQTLSQLYSVNCEQSKHINEGKEKQENQIINHKEGSSYYLENHILINQNNIPPLSQFNNHNQRKVLGKRSFNTAFDTDMSLNQVNYTNDILEVTHPQWECESPQSTFAAHFSKFNNDIVNPDISTLEQVDFQSYLKSNYLMENSIDDDISFDELFNQMIYKNMGL